jgi:L-asparaginase/Glu-tRNA(Gln) amidotransferase subunit D
MRNEVLVLTTGGTIGCLVNEKVKIIDDSQFSVVSLIQNCNIPDKNEVIVVPVFNKNSEDIELRDWVQLSNIIKEKQQAGYHKIVITHGTDTLAYTATVLSFLSTNSSSKICLTGSFLAPTEENSDAQLNLSAAIACVRSSTLASEVYIAFRNNSDNRRAAIISAVDLKPLEFDADSFTSLYKRKIAIYTEKDQKLRATGVNGRMFPNLNGNLTDEKKLVESASLILLASVFPAMDANAFAPILREQKILVLSMYHSGTAPSFDTKGSLLRLATECSNGSNIFMAAIPSQHMRDSAYESTIRLAKVGANIYKDIQAHQLYIFLLLGTAMGISISKLKAILEPWRFDATFS